MYDIKYNTVFDQKNSRNAGHGTCNCSDFVRESLGHPLCCSTWSGLNPPPEQVSQVNSSLNLAVTLEKILAHLLVISSFSHFFSVFYFYYLAATHLFLNISLSIQREYLISTFGKATVMVFDVRHAET